MISTVREGPIHEVEYMAKTMSPDLQYKLVSLLYNNYGLLDFIGQWERSPTHYCAVFVDGVYLYKETARAQLMIMGIV